MALLDIQHQLRPGPATEVLRASTREQRPGRRYIASPPQTPGRWAGHHGGSAPRGGRSSAAAGWAVTQLAAFMVMLDVSIVNVALPSIERDLAVSTMTASGSYPVMR